MSDDLKTIDVDINDLKHHGILGMKWGKWNAETAARYAGVSRKFLKNVANKTVSVGKKTTKRVGDSVSESIEKHKTERAQKIEKKREQKAFDKETRKKYHLSKKQYDKLRERTINSNDPSIVRKGMHLLNDEELKTKINRLEQEQKINNMAFNKESNEATVRGKQLEAKQKTLGYTLAKTAGTYALGAAKEKVLEPGLDLSLKKVNEVIKKSNQRKEEADLRAKEERQKKEQKKEEAFQQRKEEAAKETEKLVEYMRQRESDNWKEGPSPQELQQQKENEFQQRKEQAAKETEKLVEYMKKQREAGNWTENTSEDNKRKRYS